MNISNNCSPNFGHFRLSENAGKSLSRLEIPELCQLRHTINHIKYTTEFDFGLDKNLKPKIYDNSKLYTSYLPPYNVSIDEGNTRKLKISTTELNEHPLGNKEKKSVDLYVRFKNYKEAENVYKRIQYCGNEIEKGMIITKLLDVDRLGENDNKYFKSLRSGKRAIIDDLLYRNGNSKIDV